MYKCLFYLLLMYACGIKVLIPLKNLTDPKAMSGRVVKNVNII